MGRVGKQRNLHPKYNGTIDSPELGDIRSRKDIGLKSNGVSMWMECHICKIPKWIRISKNHIPEYICYSCSNRVYGCKATGTINKPVLGDTRKGTDLGHVNSVLYKYIECPICGDKRWTILEHGMVKYLKCNKCSHIGFKEKIVRALIKKGTYLGEKGRWLKKREYLKKRYQEVKIKVFSHYIFGKDKTIKCADPFHMHKHPVTDTDVLSIDHINNNGAQDRGENQNGHSGSTYGRLVREGYPLGFQVLCHNCQQKKRRISGDLSH